MVENTPASLIDALNPALREDLRSKGIDVERTCRIMANYNAGKYADVVPVKANRIPEIDGRRIIDCRAGLRAAFDPVKAQNNLERLGLGLDARGFGVMQGEALVFDLAALRRLGRRLYPVLAYGVLNGGSGSSYADHKRNESFHPGLYNLCRNEFSVLEGLSKGQAKGLAPAFINPDLSPGPGFLELKLRAILLEELRFRQEHGRHAASPVLPLFQMTSIENNALLAEACRQLRDSHLLAELIAATGHDVTEMLTGVQPMLAAYTPLAPGEPLSVFDRAFGREHTALAMPGGHGQNFDVLRQVYADLYRRGIRYIYLGNVDNLGYTVAPEALALVALGRRQAGFEFVFRTVVDVKGGILVVDQKEHLNCADIGPAISKEEVMRAEAEGGKILFNCAIGLFDLEYLTANLDHIVDSLPMRFSNQDKDAGKYSQAEQVTWEIIGMLEDSLILAVSKQERFLAAKLLLETLMTSGVHLDDPAYPTDANPEKDLRAAAAHLHQGLQDRLRGVYGMKLEGGCWLPKTVAELTAEMSAL